MYMNFTGATAQMRKQANSLISYVYNYFQVFCISILPILKTHDCLYGTKLRLRDFTYVNENIFLALCS